MTALTSTVDAWAAGTLDDGGPVPSFEAYQAYVQGRDAFWHGDGRRAESLFVAALRLDTAFSAAAAGAATAAAANYHHCPFVDSLQRVYGGANRQSGAGVRAAPRSARLLRPHHAARLTQITGGRVAPSVAPPRRPPPGYVQHSIAHIALVVRDYDEAIAFYTERLGFTLVEDTYQSEQDKRWVVVAPAGAAGPGSTSLLLARAATPEQARFVGDQAGGRVFLFLRTDDFWRDYRRMCAAGVTFVRAPKEAPYGTVAVFEDLYGNRWDLVQFTAPA